MRSKTKNKKKLTINDVNGLRSDLSSYISTGFIGDMSESESQDEARKALDLIFEYFENVKPTIIKRKVCIPGYENDEEITNAKYDISKVLAGFDQLRENIGLEKSDYKISLSAPVKVKLICMKMHVMLRKIKPVDEGIVVKSLENMFYWLSKDPYWVSKFNLNYLEKAFDSAYDAALGIKRKLQSNPEWVLQNS